jgi:hypothetical protein
MTHTQHPSTWDWGDVRAGLLARLEVAVANQSVPLRLGGVVHRVNAHVDDHGAGLEPVSLHHLGPSDSGNNYIRLLNESDIFIMHHRHNHRPNRRVVALKLTILLTWRNTSGIFSVRECTIVTVAFLCMSSRATGTPT